MLFALALAVLTPVGHARAADIPGSWVSRGPGGGGAFYGPAINPHNPDHIFVQSDMGELFFSGNSGGHWRTLDFRQVKGGNTMANIQFTAMPNIMYCINFRTVDFLDTVTPSISTDSGQTWRFLSGDIGGETPYSLFADPDRTNRLIVSTYGDLYFSDDSGATFAIKYSASDLHLAGAFFDNDTIYVGTQVGLVISTNGGNSFALAGNTGIPGTEAMVSFSGAKSGATTRLYCVTVGSGDVWPGVTGAEYATYQGVYRLDYAPAAAWTGITTGIGADYAFFVGTCRTNINIAYLAGVLNSPTFPTVYRTTNGGTSWSRVFKPVNNENIYTGWQGNGGDEDWWYGEYPLGFSVCPGDSDRAVVTDLGYVHITTNGGLSWYAAYVHSSDLNPTNTLTPKGRDYHGIGLEDTTCWWLTWSDPTNIFASFTDITATRTDDGGMTWSKDHTGLDRNTVYCCLKHPNTGYLYASDSSVHDLFQSTYLTDAKIDAGAGGVFRSTDKGANWQQIHNFGHPVTGLALDPNSPDRLYACVVHSSAGGIFMTSNLNAGASSTWVKLGDPPRTEGHPWTVLVLDDGTLACTYSGRRDVSGFTLSSGVFVSTNGGASWVDRSHTDMRRWTKDLVIDPHDPGQQTWYAAVFSHWGSYPNEVGGLYRTVNRGVDWTLLTGSAFHRVESCTVSPDNPNVAFIATETQGLWFSTNFASATPDFEIAGTYPFAHPVRVFHDPYNTNEIWVTSFGNGMRMGRIEEPRPAFSSIQVEIDGLSGELTGASGQELEILSTTNILAGWAPVSTQWIAETCSRFRHHDPVRARARFYKARVRP